MSDDIHTSLANRYTPEELLAILPEIFKTEIFNPVCQILIQAGAFSTAFKSSDIAVDFKADNSEVTFVDQKLSEYFIKWLPMVFGDYAVSEENMDAYPDFDLQQSRCWWLIDPLDGTKGYAQGRNDYCHMVTFVDAGVPLMTFLYEPATARLRYAVKNLGVFAVTIDPSAIHYRWQDKEVAMASFMQEVRKAGEQAFALGEVFYTGSFKFKRVLNADTLNTYEYLVSPGIDTVKDFTTSQELIEQIQGQRLAWFKLAKKVRATIADNYKHLYLYQQQRGQNLSEELEAKLLAPSRFWQQLLKHCAPLSKANYTYLAQPEQQEAYEQAAREYLLTQAAQPTDNSLAAQAAAQAKYERVLEYLQDAEARTQANAQFLQAICEQPDEQALETYAQKVVAQATRYHRYCRLKQAWQESMFAKIRGDVELDKLDANSDKRLIFDTLAKRNTSIGLAWQRRLDVVLSEQVARIHHAAKVIVAGKGYKIGYDVDLAVARVTNQITAHDCPFDAIEMIGAASLEEVKNPGCTAVDLSKKLPNAAIPWGAECVDNYGQPLANSAQWGQRVPFYLMAYSIEHLPQAAYKQAVRELATFFDTDLQATYNFGGKEKVGMELNLQHFPDLHVLAINNQLEHTERDYLIERYLTYARLPVSESFAKKLRFLNPEQQFYLRILYQLTKNLCAIAQAHPNPYFIINSEHKPEKYSKIRLLQGARTQVAFGVFELPYVKENFTLETMHSAGVKATQVFGDSQPGQLTNYLLPNAMKVWDLAPALVYAQNSASKFATIFNLVDVTQVPWQQTNFNFSTLDVYPLIMSEDFMSIPFILDIPTLMYLQLPRLFNFLAPLKRQALALAHQAMEHPEQETAILENLLSEGVDWNQFVELGLASIARETWLRYVIN